MAAKSWASLVKSSGPPMQTASPQRPSPLPLATDSAKKAKPIVHGIANLGNTCYASAVIQALASCERLVVLLRSHVGSSPPPSSPEEASLSRELSNVFMALSSPVGAPDLRSVLSTTKILYPAFEDGGKQLQQDAEEFFSFVIGRLSEELAGICFYPSLDLTVHSL